MHNTPKKKFWVVVRIECFTYFTPINIRYHMLRLLSQTNYILLCDMWGIFFLIRIGCRCSVYLYLRFACFDNPSCREGVAGNLSYGLALSSNKYPSITLAKVGEATAT